VTPAPALTIVVTTSGRPRRLPLAVESALAQPPGETVVLVVDDGSDPPVRLPPDRRLRVVRHERRRGVSAARNRGAGEATTRFVAYLDDDDVLLPHMAETSLAAWEGAALPPPVGVLSGVDVVDERGTVLERRRPPPARPRGSHFALEPLEPGCSYATKQTLVVERDVLRSVGGFDEGLRSRVTTDLFLRLNPVCSLLGVPTVTYRLLEHDEARLSRDRDLRQESFRRLLERHGATMAAHPEGFSELLWQHARMSARDGRRTAAAVTVARHARLFPRRTLARLAGML
jgi:glycosyltransferase involved in cell wall biosynthesis